MLDWDEFNLLFGDMTNLGFPVLEVGVPLHVSSSLRRFKIESLFEAFSRRKKYLYKKKFVLLFLFYF